MTKKLVIAPKRDPRMPVGTVIAKCNFCGETKACFRGAIKFAIDIPKTTMKKVVEKTRMRLFSRPWSLFGKEAVEELVDYTFMPVQLEETEQKRADADICGDCVAELWQSTDKLKDVKPPQTTTSSTTPAGLLAMMRGATTGSGFSIEVTHRSSTRRTS